MKIAIVDENDNIIGSEERDEIYQKGLIHRFVRILLFNNKGEILLQWRGANEDTFPNTWDQSAGGHVDEGEDYEVAASRELEEEIGVKDVKLTLLNKFYTEGQVGIKIIKRFNAVFKAEYSGELKLQEEEVDSVKWFSIKELKYEIEKNPGNFTKGLKTILEKMK